MRSTISFLTLFLVLHLNLRSQTPTIGLIHHSPKGLDNGYVLFAPNSNKQTFLIDKCGNKVHSWSSAYVPGLSVYLLPDGNLLRTGKYNNPVFTAGGNGGIIEKMDWNGNVVWSYVISDNLQCQHHDIKSLPNGNVLAIVWDYKTVTESINAGYDTSILGAGPIWSEKIVELQPVGTNSANIVWEWKLWDHLVQDFDSTRANYGNVSANPQLMNLNFTTATGPDWIHFNAIDYNPSLDQILISSRQQDEIYVIDHSTTTAEAASHSAGTRGKGGDFLYRWGNPASYGQGSVQRHRLFGQHNAQWISPGLPNEGKILVFNNGNGRTGGNYSSVDIIDAPIDSSGAYNQTLPYGPDSAFWSYHDPIPSNFYSAFISGAQQLSNKNVLVCNAGKFFEIDSAKTEVWNYINPVSSSTLTQGSAPVGISSFRCTFYPDSYSGFSGQTLTPMGPIESNPYSSPMPQNAPTLTVGTNSGCNATSSSLVAPLQINCNVSALSNDASATLSLGTTVVTWTVTDGSSNVTTVTQTVTVTDNVNPTISAPTDLVLTVSTACDTSGISLGVPVTSDNCTVAGVTNNAPSVFAAGNTIVTWTVTDGSGNTATATQTVTVHENVAPDITAPVNVAVSANSACTATAVALGSPVTSDNCMVTGVLNDAPTAFPVGNTVVTWTVTDASGNIATATQTVTVSDVTNPSIVAPANISAVTNSGCYATGLSLGTPTTGDNCSVANVASDAPTSFPTGNTIVTWTVTDASGNTSTATQTISVTSSLASSQTLTVCSGGSLVVGTNTYSVTGIYSDTLQSAGGCDSVVTSDLTVDNAIDVSTTVAGAVATANASGATYQWIDCDNNNTAISGATSQSYTASVTGNYAVAITSNSCSDTSACVNIIVNGITSKGVETIKVYPNPSEGVFTIELKSQAGKDLYLELHDNMGRLIVSETRMSSGEDRLRMNILNFDNGTYLLSVKDASGRIVQRVNLIKL